MSMRPAAESNLAAQDGPRRNERRAMHAPDITEIIERLESQVVNGRRVMSKVMVDESEFLALVDQLREAIPAELQQARRVIQQRQEIILDAQGEADKILATARERAEYLISERGLTAEARYRGEDVLRGAEEKARTTISQVDRYAQQLLDDVELVMTRNLSDIEKVVSRQLSDIGQAKSRLSERA